MWHFKKSDLLDSNRRSKLDEFFSAQNVATSVVREAIQNSLDAPLDDEEGKVNVRFTLSEQPWENFEDFINTTDAELTLDSHTSCNDLDRYAKSFKGKTLRCLAIEDYGTKGLTGTTDKNEALSGSNFVGFWWNEGITGKGKGTRGSHGVGKTTLTRASEMSTFWGLTKRADDEETFLIGFSNLPFHRLNNCSFLGYGRFGERIKKDAEEQFMPVTAPSIIEKFSDTFGLDRSGYGLSVLIPAVTGSISHDSILQAVIEDYYWPILKGDLAVSIIDKVAGTETEICKDNLSTAMDQLSSEAVRYQRIQNLVQSASYVHGMKSGHPNYFPGIQPKLDPEGNQKRAHLTSDCFTPDNLARIKDQFVKGEMVAVQFSVKLEPKDSAPVTGTFEIFLRGPTDEGPERISQYIRRGLIVTEQNVGIGSKFSCCFVIIDDRDMSNLLATAEGPAHTSWVLKKFQSSGAYKSDWPLRFIMDAANQLYRVVAGEDEEQNEIQNFADDIFSINRPGAGSGSEQKQKPDKPQETKVPVPPSGPKPVEVIRVERLDDGTGFAIHSAKDLGDALETEGVSLPFRIDVVSAYLSVRGNSRSFKDYTPLDFDYSKDIALDTSPPEAVRVINQSGNRLSLHISQVPFTIKVKGFDPHRDLLNRTDLKVLEGEASS